MVPTYIKLIAERKFYLQKIIPSLSPPKSDKNGIRTPTQFAPYTRIMYGISFLRKNYKKPSENYENYD
jgi:hypothetical protein